MQVRVIRFSSLFKPYNETLVKQLVKLTHPETTAPGHLAGQMITIKSGMKLAVDNRHPHGSHVSVAHENGTPVGWAISFISDIDGIYLGDYLIMIYVREDLRRQGIGRKIVAALKAVDNPLIGGTSHPFFDAVECRPPGWESLLPP